MAVNPTLGGSATLAQILMNSQNQQGNFATAPDPSMVRDASTHGQQFPFSAINGMIPPSTGMGMNDPSLKIGGANPFQGAQGMATQQAQSPMTPMAGTPASQPAAQGMPAQAQSPFDAIMSLLAPKPPQAPLTYGPNDAQQQQLGDLRSQGSDLMAQASAARLAAASQPLPQIHHLGLLESLIPLIGSFVDHSGKFNNAFNQSFEQQAGQQHQQGLQNFQQQQNIAGIKAGGLEQQAQSKFGAATAMLQQIKDQDELREKERGAEYGYAGKGLGAEATVMRAQITSAATKAAREYASDNRAKSLETQSLLGQYFSPTATPEAKQAALTALQAKDPDFAKLDPQMTEAVVNQLPPAYKLQVANVFKAQQQGALIAKDVNWADRLNDAKYRDTLAKAMEAIDSGALAIARAKGLPDETAASTAEKIANTQRIMQQVRQYPDDVKLKAAAAESALELAKSKIAIAGQQVAAGAAGSNQNLIDSWKGLIQTYKDQASVAGVAANKYVTNGMPPPQGQDADYKAMVAKRNEALNAAGDLQDRLRTFLQAKMSAAALKTAKPASAGDPIIITPVGGASAYGTNPNSVADPSKFTLKGTIGATPPKPSALPQIQYAGSNPITSAITLPTGKVSRISDIIRTFNSAVTNGQMGRAQALQTLRTWGVTAK
jgi:hypothetical protein